MREAVGILAATGLLAFAGTGVLLGVGLVERSSRGVAAGLGLAYLIGVATVIPVGIALLTLGVSFRLPLFAAACVILGSGGTWIASRRAATPPEAGDDGEPARVPSPLRIAGLTLGALALAYVLVWVFTFVSIPLHVWDAWSIWGRKGTILATADGLPTAYFVDGAYRFMHQDYPLLLPLLESVYFRAMGGVHTEAIHAVFWVLLASFGAALAYLASAVARVWVYAAVVGAAVFAPLVYGQLSTAYADVPMGFLLALGVLLLARWTSSGDPRELAIAALLLAAAGATKNEGLPAAAGALAAAALVSVAPRRAALKQLGLAAAGAAAVLAPWWIWLAAHDVRGDVPVGKGLEPGYLWDRADRLLPTLEALGRETVKQGGWLVPAALVVAAVALATGVCRRIVAFYAITATVAGAAVVWTFAITRNTLDYQIETSASRVVAGVVFVALAALVHIGGLLDRGAGARGGRSGA